MDELIKTVSQKAGISEDSARTAVNTVVSFIKGKLPESFHGHIDSALGSSAAATGINAAANALGGLFGKK